MFTMYMTPVVVSKLLPMRYNQNTWHVNTVERYGGSYEDLYSTIEYRSINVL